MDITQTQKKGRLSLVIAYIFAIAFAVMAIAFISDSVVTIIGFRGQRSGTHFVIGSFLIFLSIFASLLAVVFGRFAMRLLKHYRSQK